MLRLHMILAATISLFLANASTAGIILVANMTNAAEAPVANTPNAPPSGVPLTAGPGALDPTAPRPASFGHATFFLNDAQTALTMTATIFNIDVTGTQTAGLNDNLVAAHIHASPTVTTGTAPVVWGFFGSPDNDVNPNDLVVTPFSTGVGGTFTSKWDAPEGNNGTTLAAQLANLLSEHAYINFHTTQFTGGEIRGFLVIPEPSPLALLAAGAVVLLGFLRRQDRSIA